MERPCHYLLPWVSDMGVRFPLTTGAISIIYVAFSFFPPPKIIGVGL